MSRRALALFLLALGGLSALGFGIYGLVSPSATAAAVSLEPQNAFGRGEIRALYGGMWTAMGVLVFGALRQLASRGRLRPRYRNSRDRTHSHDRAVLDRSAPRARARHPARRLRGRTRRALHSRRSRNGRHFARRPCFAAHSTRLVARPSLLQQERQASVPASAFIDHSAAHA